LQNLARTLSDIVHNWEQAIDFVVMGEFAEMACREMTHWDQQSDALQPSADCG
jgi:hypothetical protein